MKETIKEEINIRKIEGQLKAALIELEDLRNRSMRSTLIFKNIKEERKETWEDTARILTNFIVEDLKLSYRYDEIDNQISRAHRGSSEDSNDNQPITKAIEPFMLNLLTGGQLRRYKTE